MRNPRRRKKVTDVMRRLSVTDGDILLIKEGSGLATKEIIDQFVESLSRMGYYKTLVIVVSSLDDLEQLSAEEMLKYGWQRIPESKEEQEEQDNG